MQYVEHIGIAVRDLEKANDLFARLLGQGPYKIETVESEKVRTSFFRNGETKIELLESLAPEGPIGKFIEKRGEGIHHIAFAQEGVASALDHARECGVQLIDQGPRKGAEGLDIGFLHPRSTFGVLMEFCGKD